MLEINNYCQKYNITSKSVEKAIFKLDNQKQQELKNILKNIEDIPLEEKNILELLSLDINNIKYISVCLNNFHLKQWLLNKDNLKSFIRLELDKKGILATFINDFANLHHDKEFMKLFYSLDIVQIYYFIQQLKDIQNKDITNEFILLDVLKKIT